MSEHKRHRKGFLIFSIFVGAVFALALLIFFGLGFYLSPQDKLEKVDAIVVISGGRTTIRAEKGIELYKEGWAANMLFSGAALDDGPSNAAAMEEQAIEAGISQNAIETDEDSQTTYQNATNSKRIMDDHGWKNILLVTSPYHQKRANLTFSYVLGDGYKIIGVSAVDDRWSKRRWWQSGFAFNVSMDELRKILFIKLTGHYQ